MIGWIILHYVVMTFVDRTKYDYCKGDLLRIPKGKYHRCPQCNRLISKSVKNKKRANRRYREKEQEQKDAAVQKSM